MSSCADAIAGTFHHGVWNRGWWRECFGDCAFLDIDPVKLLLTACYDNLIGSFAGEAHAAEILHVWEADVPLCKASPGGQVHALVGDGDYATIAEEKLLYWYIIRRGPVVAADMAAVGRVFLQFGAVKRSDASLHEHERLLQGGDPHDG